MWNNIIGQERVIKILSNFYQGGKIPHALIFHGKEGVGKDAAAIEFAKLVNCDNPENNEACDSCKSCRQISNFGSPYFKFITALPTGKKQGDNDSNPISLLAESDREIYNEEIRRKASDNYYRISIPRANNIRIDDIRQIRKEIYLTTQKGKTKTVLISNADMMNPQSSNAFLKILEEPPSSSLLILTTSRINHLLPTITGRCQKIKFDNIKTDDILNYLMSTAEGITEKEAGLYARVADGSIVKCRNIIESYFMELRDNVIEILRAAIAGQFLKMSSVITSVTESKSKEKVRTFLFLNILWFRDIVCIHNENPELVINKDRLENLKNFTSRYRTENFEIINMIEDAMRDLDYNINMELLLFSLFMRIKVMIKTLQ